MSLRVTAGRPSAGTNVTTHRDPHRALLALEPCARLLGQLDVDLERPGPRDGLARPCRPSAAARASGASRSARSTVAFAVARPALLNAARTCSRPLRAAVASASCRARASPTSRSGGRRRGGGRHRRRGRVVGGGGGRRLRRGGLAVVTPQAVFSAASAACRAGRARRARVRGRRGRAGAFCVHAQSRRRCGRCAAIDALDDDRPDALEAARVVGHRRRVPVPRSESPTTLRRPRRRCDADERDAARPCRPAACRRPCGARRPRQRGRS